LAKIEGRNLKKDFIFCYFLESGAKLSAVLAKMLVLTPTAFSKKSPLFRPDKIGTQDAPLERGARLLKYLFANALFWCGGRKSKKEIKIPRFY